MAKETVKDFKGVIIGFINDLSRGDKEATDYKGVKLGFYRKDRNYTTNLIGQIIGSGDILSSLIWAEHWKHIAEQEQKRKEQEEAAKKAKSVWKK